MKKISSIQLKALFLLTVFALNTVAGFACSMGVDMGFNKTHHHEEAQAVTPSVHVHADGKKHEHHNKSAAHHHDEKETNGKGGCCNDAVIKFQNIDKALSQNVKALLDVPVFTVTDSTYFSVDLLKISKKYPEKYNTRLFYPPPPDIRIAIQSFQI